jgi:hypothetical protein
VDGIGIVGRSIFWFGTNFDSPFFLLLLLAIFVVVAARAEMAKEWYPLLSQSEMKSFAWRPQCLPNRRLPTPNPDRTISNTHPVAAAAAHHRHCH